MDGRSSTSPHREGLEDKKQPVFLQFNFPSKTRQDSRWNLGACPYTPPVLKIEVTFSYTPPERGRTDALVLRDPGAAGSPYCLPEPSMPRRAQNPEGWAESLVFSYSSQRSLSQNLIPEKIHQS